MRFERLQQLLVEMRQGRVGTRRCVWSGGKACDISKMAMLIVDVIDDDGDKNDDEVYDDENGQLVRAKQRQNLQKKVKRRILHLK